MKKILFNDTYIPDCNDTYIEVGGSKIYYDSGLNFDVEVEDLSEVNFAKTEKVVKPILDACCGGKMFYFDKNDPRVLFQDIREVETTLCDGRHFEVKPDVQADFTAMPYPDNHFRMVVFDPPHLLRNVGKSKMADMYGSLNEKAQPTGYQHIKYGALYSDWRDMLSRGFAECFRVLMPGGFLIFKWNETDIKVSEVLKLTDQKPIFGHISGKRANTHWICFMK